MKFEWEEIDRKSYGYTERAKVFGGWLIRVVDIGDVCYFGMTFVPDHNHEWVINA